MLFNSNFPLSFSVQAGQVMGKTVKFFQPVERVGIIYDFLKSTNHSVFPVVDKDNNNVLFGTIDRAALIQLLKLRAFGKPMEKLSTIGATDGVISSYYIEANGNTYVPIPGYEEVERVYTNYKPCVSDLRISPKDRELLMDLRPYANQSPISIQESASVARTYELFRTMGLRFLPVVNKNNQIVGTITRADLTPEGLATTMLLKEKKHL
jgi:chloride channel 7